MLGSKISMQKTSSHRLDRYTCTCTSADLLETNNNNNTCVKQVLNIPTTALSEIRESTNIHPYC